ncbi:hypothetical protein MRX96_012157 [Rhipicephalus microplus]
MAAQIPWIKGQEKEVFIVNDKQGTLIFSTPDIDTVWKVTRIKSIKIEGKSYDVTAYLAPHEDSGRGVLRDVFSKGSGFSSGCLSFCFGCRCLLPRLGQSVLQTGSHC